MVAKSFQSMKQLGEPFLEKGRLYVNVQNEKSGTVRKVRWYTDAEYAKMYGEKVNKPASEFKCQKQILGFENGYITIFKGDTYANLEWFQKSIARYCKWWGWYIVSTDPIPFDLPVGIEPVRLDWDKVGHSTGELKDAESISAIVASLLYGSHPSVFQGKVGDRLDLNVTVIKLVQKDKYFGNKITKNAMHTFEDACGNHYMWDTAAKCWAEGSVKHIKGSVKEHKVINNVQTTVLTRCIEQM